MKHPILLLMGALFMGLAACTQSETTSTTTSATTDVAAPVVGVAPQPMTDTENTTTLSDEQPTAEAITDTDTDTVAIEPNENTPAIETIAADNVDWLMVTNRIDYDLSLLGNPDAPITMIEYSDFM